MCAAVRWCVRSARQWARRGWWPGRLWTSRAKAWPSRRVSLSLQSPYGTLAGKRIACSFLALLVIPEMSSDGTVSWVHLPTCMGVSASMLYTSVTAVHLGV